METCCYISKTIQLVFLYVFLLLKIATAVSQQPYRFDFYCDNENGNYTQNSLYRRDLFQLLRKLGGKASESYFYKATTGVSPDKIYGMYYCRRDISPRFCRDCVQTAAQWIIRNCTNQREAIVWYEQCTLRYANRPIFGPEDDKYTAWTWGYSDEYVTNPYQLQQALSRSMRRLIRKAAYDEDYLGYATGEDSVPPDSTLYSLVQCSPDILGRPCENCLRGIYSDMDTCCNGGRVTVWIFRSNCHMMYDMTPFYNQLPPSSSDQSPSHYQSPSQHQSPTTAKRSRQRQTNSARHRSGKGGKKAGLLGGGLVLLVLIGISIIIYCCMCKKKKNPKPTGT